MSEDDLTGKNIQGYFVQKPIGQGKFATVYKAETADKKVVALKKIRIFEMNDPKLRDKCLKEVKLMQHLEHPNIIKYLDSFIANNELIIITEWAEKGDLKKVLKNAITAEAPIEEYKVWEYMHQMALALKHMHDKRIMHRDLKPANIFISGDDVLKVGDFGLGRVFSEETVEAYSKVGTPLYMSPELLIGQGYDMKSDVWSIGCIIYEMCEMRSPFRNDDEKMSLMDLFNNITKGEYKPVSERFSDELRNTINEMIVVNPQNRCDTGKVIEACQAWKEKQKGSLKIDCLIVMEDIIEKLNLLNYRALFCGPRKLQPIPKTYFAINEVKVSKQQKFDYFIELSYWLISLIQETKKANTKSPGMIKSKLDDPPNLVASKLLEAIETLDIHLESQITPESLCSSKNLKGIGEAVCFVLNELINKRLILINYEFFPPKLGSISDETSEVIEEDGIKELEPGKIFKTESRYSFESDDEDDFKGPKEYIQTISTTTYQSDITSATSTLLDMGKSKRPASEVIKDDMTIYEDELTEIDPIEWNREVLRVSKELNEFHHKLETGELMLFKSIDDKVFHLEALNNYNTEIKKCLKNVRNHPWQKKVEYWGTHMESIQKGEKRLNKAIAGLTDDFKELVREKGEIFKKMSSQTASIKQKVEGYEKSTQKLKNLEELIKEKESSISGDDKKIELQKGIANLKKEISQMDVRLEVLKNLMLKFERKKTEDSS